MGADWDMNIGLFIHTKNVLKMELVRLGDMSVLRRVK